MTVSYLNTYKDYWWSCN